MPRMCQFNRMVAHTPQCGSVSDARAAELAECDQVMRRWGKVIMVCHTSLSLSFLCIDIRNELHVCIVLQCIFYFIHNVFFYRTGFKKNLNRAGTTVSGTGMQRLGKGRKLTLGIVAHATHRRCRSHRRWWIRRGIWAIQNVRTTAYWKRHIINVTSIDLKRRLTSWPKKPRATWMQCEVWWQWYH